MKKSLITLIALALAAVMVFAACAPAAPPPADPPAPPEAPADPPADPPEPGDEPAPDWDLNNDDLMGPGLGEDLGLGPVGHDLDALVERMGRDFVADLRIGVSINNQATIWQVNWVREFQRLADIYGFDLTILTSGDDSIQAATDLRSFQSQHVDGIIAYLHDPGAMVSTLNEVQASGIPIIHAIEVAPGTDISGYLYVSQYEMGVRMADLAAHHAATYRGEDAYVMLLCLSIEFPLLQNRTQGFIDGAARHDNVHIVDHRAHYTEDGILNTLVEGLMVNEEVNTISTSWSFPFHAGFAAAEQVGVDVWLYATDVDDLGLLMLADGTAQGGLHPIFANAHASLSFFMLLRAINGDTFPMSIPESALYAGLVADHINAREIYDIIFG